LLVDGRPLGVVDVRRFTAPPMDEQMDANFGEQLLLLGYVLDEPSETLRLIWQASPQVLADYTVFVHLVDAAGNRLAGSDGQPPVPTSQWVRDEVVIDERVVPIPDDLPPGDYWLAVGLYHPDTGERLPIFDSSGAVVGDGLMLPISLTPDSVRVED
jgi:hypothetical protein